MATIPVQFIYRTGLKQNYWSRVRLMGSWDQLGSYADQWSCVDMQAFTADDGCPGFTATVALDASQVGQQFHWGVILDSPQGTDRWGIPTEVKDQHAADRHRSFILQAAPDHRPQQEWYYLTHTRRFGAQKYYLPDRVDPALRFAVWAPHARNVEVVFGDPRSGYIADDGFGMDPHLGPFPMIRTEDGVWQTDLTISPELSTFAAFDHRPYLFRIIKEDGQVAYRTDLYARCQIGQGNIDPKGEHYGKPYTELDGTKSCSVVIDPDTVSQQFVEDTFAGSKLIAQEQFWQDEFNPDRPVPNRVEDLVIYELHLGALGYGQNRPGNFQDAMDLLPYWIELGINAIELLPLSEFRDKVNWGYETSHYFALEYSAGGRDQLKHFVRACHRQGIAVILDVVYNHYNPDGERAEWAYDSNTPERNLYYWYEGQAADYADPSGGYLDNWSTGYAPRFWEENVRKLFISSAAALVEEFHVDGFRVDQTTSMHLYNVLHANGRSVEAANRFGAKFLREWTRTLKLVWPDVILIAEDHSDWAGVTTDPDQGGLGFDATWYANFYHHLVGDTRQGTDYAKLIATAGHGTDIPLAMDRFAAVLAETGHRKVVYHESHDEAGNSYYEEAGQKVYSRRTIVSAVNGAPLVGKTRHFAEARCHFAVGMAMLSAGTPMFLMGEEVGAQKPYRYQDFLENQEDLLGEKTVNGAKLFKFYQDLIQFRRTQASLRSHQIEVIHVHNINRVIAFCRWDDQDELLIIASLNNHPFTHEYDLRHNRIGNYHWREVFNSDAILYGGANVGNFGETIVAMNGYLHVEIPANGFVVFQKMNDYVRVEC
ncbi:MAG: alpha-amylase family glycosyl hydrolase [Elainella sp. Prado103]|nr:alpha-amylase family glycosyl hydrolase [Elainella sp. Prado103]